MNYKLERIKDLLIEAEEIWDEISEELHESTEGPVLEMVQHVNRSLPNTRINFEDIIEAISEEDED